MTRKTTYTLAALGLFGLFAATGLCAQAQVVAPNPAPLTPATRPPPSGSNQRW